MNVRSLHRLVALFLAPCLIGDPALVSTHNFGSAQGRPLQSMFTAQAITPRVVAGEGPLAPTEAKIAQAETAKRIRKAIRRLADFRRPEDLETAYGLRRQTAIDFIRAIESLGNRITLESLHQAFARSIELAKATILKEIEAAGIEDPVMRHLAEFPTAKDLAHAYGIDPMWETNIFNVIRSLSSTLTQESLLYALNHSFGSGGVSKGKALIGRAAARISAKGPTGSTAHIWDIREDGYTPRLPSENKDQRDPSLRMQSRFGVHVGAAGPGDPNALSGGRAPRRGSGSVRVRQALETSLGRLKDWMFSPLRFSATSKFVASGLVIGLGFIGLAGLFKPHHPVLAIVFIMGFLLTLGIVSMRLACGAFAAGDPSQFQRTQATARESADLRYLDRAIESATHGANVAEIGEQLGLVRRWMESHGVDGRRSPPIGLWNLVHLERLVIRLWLHPKLLLDFRQDLDFVFGTLTTRLFFGRPLNPASARASEKSA